MRKITVYETKNGKRFDNFEDAVKDEGGFICPKCSGVGYTTKVIPGEWGYTEDIYKKINCDLCNGLGYTKRELKPIMKKEVVGYE